MITTEILKARIEDAVEISLKTNKPKFLGFLTEEQAVFTQNLLSKINVNYKLFGGYRDAKRVVLCCYPDWCENLEFPISSITLKFRKSDKISHRDFLGSLMGLGLKREAIGDILCEDGRAVIFVMSEIEDYIIEQLTKVGRTGVEIVSGYEKPLPVSSELRDFSVTVASDRLDCIVSALINCSRNIASEKISLGLITINSVIIEKNTKAVVNGDIISIRGYGKFIIDSLSDKTRKNRLILKYKKYI